ncbi:MAG: 2-amino-4-hydroxy-6-hydroxymethyldihydropteridine diphosphokinase, partial [bacterium]|nr:2-amino-4-hydroxy-6-hydroxymethyldihydropteridine diphosphokinase [bacterium]
MPEPTHIPANAFIALGSNLGDREFAIESARTALGRHPEIETVRCSSLIETDPVGPPGQGPYLNGVTMVRTTLSPRALLDAMLAIERSLGRIREESTERWGPRTIDLDLVLYSDLIIDEPGLTIPQQRLHERRFVMQTLVQIANDVLH